MKKEIEPNVDKIMRANVRAADKLIRHQSVLCAIGYLMGEAPKAHQEELEDLQCLFCEFRNVIDDVIDILEGKTED